MEHSNGQSGPKVALLTAGRDRPYAFGMASVLMRKGIALDIIGGSDLDDPQWYTAPHVAFLNYRGDSDSQASVPSKVIRILYYYARLLRYTLTSRADVFHILWNNKFEAFDRVPLMLYYKLLGKRTVLTVHNVNAGERDGCDSWFNRWTLKVQYRLADHLFVHTNRMKKELTGRYRVATEKVSVIPFGINNAVPQTDLTPNEARQRLGISEFDRTLLFFGNIAPYKGLEYLIDAFQLINQAEHRYRLVIAGHPKNCEDYWICIQALLNTHRYQDRILQKIEFVPDCDTEIYFKAADVLVLPYRHVFQSGVLSLGYSFGLPVIASDVGSLREDILEERTGFVSRPEDAKDLVSVIERYFSSELYRGLSHRRSEIRSYASTKYSWETVGDQTVKVYAKLRDGPSEPERLSAAR